MRTRVAILLAALALMFSVADVASAQSSSPRTYTPLEKVTPYVQPSVVYLSLHWQGWIYDTYNKNYLNGGHPFTEDFQCTGFIVTPDGYIGTAGHCVDPLEVRPYFLTDAAKWAIKNHYYLVTPSLSKALQFADNDFRIEGANKGGGNGYKKSPDLTITAAWSVSVSGLSSGDSAPAQPVSFKPLDQGDAALLKIDAQDLTPLLFAKSADISTGEEVVSIGYPASVESVSDAKLSDPSFKDGTVSSVRTVGNGLLNVYEVSSALSGGMSGGPTVDLNGDVVGVNSYSPRGENQQFNFIQPIENLAQLVGGQGVTVQLGEVGTAYRRGLDAYFSGDKTTAVSSFQKVLQLQPSHALAQKYLGLARSLPNPSSSSGVLIWVLIGVGVVIVVVVALVLINRRRSSTPQPAAAAPTTPAPSAMPTYPSEAAPPTPMPMAPPASTEPMAPPASTEPVAPATLLGSVAPPTGAQPTQIGRVPSAPFVLRVTQGPEAGKEFPVRQEATIGRQDADLMITDEEVSRRHAVVRLVNGALEIEDLGSLNGTHVNGTKLTSVAPLAPGDVIQIGQCQIEVVRGGDGGGTRVGSS